MIIRVRHVKYNARIVRHAVHKILHAIHQGRDRRHGLLDHETLHDGRVVKVGDVDLGD
jgi:hypothetical protein